MPHSPLRLIRQCIEYQTIDDVSKLSPGLRGLYVLYREDPPTGRRKKSRFEVVYVGMARAGGIRSRLRQHRRKKRDLWTHFSVYQVWDNIRDDEVAELEGLLRHFFRDDPVASQLNKQRGFSSLRDIRRKSFEHWVP